MPILMTAFPGRAGVSDLIGLQHCFISVAGLSYRQVEVWAVDSLPTSPAKEAADSVPRQTILILVQLHRAVLVLNADLVLVNGQVGRGVRARDLAAVGAVADVAVLLALLEEIRRVQRDGDATA